MKDATEMPDNQLHGAYLYLMYHKATWKDGQASWEAIMAPIRAEMIRRGIRLDE